MLPALWDSHIPPPQAEPQHTQHPQRSSQAQLCLRAPPQAAFGGRWAVNAGSQAEEGAGVSAMPCWVEAAAQRGCSGWEPSLAVPRVSLACPGLPSLEGNVFVYAALPDFLCFLARGHSSHASLSVFINTNFFLSPRSAGEFLSGFYVPARLCVNSQQCYQ